MTFYNFTKITTGYELDSFIVQFIKLVVSFLE